MVSGVYHPDGGQIFFQGKELKLGSPMDALELGIETLYQDLALAENLNVYANIFLGRERTKPFLGFIQVLDHATMHEESKKVLKRLEIEIPSLKSQIKNLSGGQRQAVAIGRSIYWNAKLLIMDEPTAALGVQEQRKVLDLVRVLRSQNIPIIVISHQLYDIFSVCDRLVIMRRGQEGGRTPHQGNHPGRGGGADHRLRGGRAAARGRPAGGLKPPPVRLTRAGPPGYP